MKNIANFDLFRVNQKLLSIYVILAFVFSLFTPVTVNAATNLITDGSFEGTIENNWSMWKSNDSTRTYEVYRSYDAPFGYGSYSAAIEGTGASENRWLSGLASKKSFKINSGSYYYVVFYTKASSAMNMSLYLENNSTYSAITKVEEVPVTTEWTRNMVGIQANSNADALLTFTFGDINPGVTLNIDAVQVFLSDAKVTTTEVKGSIGEAKKYVQVTNITNFDENDIQIELPYYDNLTSEITTKKFTPISVSASGIELKMYDQTFSGVGTVYVNGAVVGNFNYNVTPKITNYTPDMPRTDEDLTVIGSGFHPAIDLEKTYLIVKTINVNGKQYDTWVKPHTIDSKLSQITAKMPMGIVNGNMYVQTSYYNKNNVNVINKTANLAYTVKPTIFSIEWQKRGYDQVGDTLRIHGKGISNNPTVIFYNESGTKLESRKAKLSEIYTDEIIEVEATTKTNNFKVTVISGGIESDKADALAYTAKPKISLVKGTYQRTVNNTNTVIPAAKVGDKITITGSGMKPDNGEYTQVSFQGLGKKVNATVGSANINSAGTSITVTVPQGALNGYLAVIVNGETSNYLPIEIVPTVIGITPDPVVPGQTVAVKANGVGKNINLAKLYFTSDGKSELSVTPTSIDFSNDVAIIYAKAPLALSNNSSSVRVQYDRWKSDGNSSLNILPTITSASINKDTKVLSIKGYGFSINSSENKITYKYADTDHTVITPKVKMLGVYPTEEGQEIRVQILDEYYYGYVTVTVDGNTSNEANFGPASVTKIARRAEYVKSEEKVMGVLYISGYNFGTTGGVKVGSNWATVHYRTDNFIIAVIDQANLYDNPVIIAK